MKPAAFRATVHGLKTVPTRKVCQITLEFPIEELPHVAQIAEHGVWVAVARIQEVAATPPSAVTGEGDACPPTSPSPPKIKHGTLAYQAVKACRDPVFWKWLEVPNEATAIARVYEILDIESRGEIISGTRAGAAWQMLESKFTAWRIAA